MKLLLDEHRVELLKRGKANAILRDSGLDEWDFNPLVKLCCPWGATTWLLTELDPEDEDTAFGLCDLSMGLAIQEHDKSACGFVAPVFSPSRIGRL